MVTPIIGSLQQQQGEAPNVSSPQQQRKGVNSSQAARRNENTLQDPSGSNSCSSGRPDLPDTGLNVAASWQVGIQYCIQDPDPGPDLTDLGAIAGTFFS